MSNEYQCAVCRGIFGRDPDAWSEADAMREYEATFGSSFGKKPEDLAIICDPCYKAAKAKFPHLFTSAMN